MSRKLELGGGVQDRFPVLDRGRLYTRVLGGPGYLGGSRNRVAEVGTPPGAEIGVFWGNRLKTQFWGGGSKRGGLGGGGGYLYINA